jgi:putative transposase
MLLSHRIRIEATSAQRDYFARAAGAAWGACHDRDTNAGINLQRLATGALAARPALPVASQAARPGTAAEDVSAAGGKVRPARHEPGQQDGSGQEENAAHLCARF